MAQQGEKRLIIAALEPVEVGEVYRKVPDRVTIMPWFELDDPQHKFISVLAAYFSMQEAISMQMGEESLFGPDKDIRVRTLVSAAIRGIHNDLLAIIAAHGGTGVDPRWTGEKYVPHITAPKEKHTANDLLVKNVHLLVKKDGSSDKTGEAVYTLGAARV